MKNAYRAGIAGPANLSLMLHTPRSISATLPAGSAQIGVADAPAGPRYATLLLKPPPRGAKSRVAVLL